MCLLHFRVTNKILSYYLQIYVISFMKFADILSTKMMLITSKDGCKRRVIQWVASLKLFYSLKRQATFTTGFVGEGAVSFMEPHLWFPLETSDLICKRLRRPGIDSEDSIPRACLGSLKGQCHEIFCFWFFSWISFPPGLEYRKSRFATGINDPVANLPSVSTTPAAICRRYQRHWRQILPPVSLLLLTPVANNGNNIRLLRP